MSPRQKYYGSLLGVAILAVLAALSSGKAQIAVVVALLALGAYMVFVRCPKCGKRLSSMGDVPGVHGLPDRYCDKCGADLSAR
jgi:uncharacterized protein with PIN domain